MDRNFHVGNSTAALPVALRKESVDRNLYYQGNRQHPRGSLSARRAWIEIGNSCTQAEPLKVALRKESVDRNSDGVVSGSGDYGRSPQGERG